MKMWTGRFKDELNPLANDFNTSIHIDHVMYKEDIEGSIAHTKMLHKVGILTAKEMTIIVDGLLAIRENIESGDLAIDPQAEDIHMFIEAELTKRVGDCGKKLHTARSRNDQVTLDTKLFLLKKAKDLATDIKTLMAVLIKKAEHHTMTIMPGYTHLQIAQPITYAHYLLAYGQMLKRDLLRLMDWQERTNEMPLGSGALATTTHPIDRDYVCKLLNFRQVTDNSLDAVSDRDYVLELSFVISTLMMHLSRLSEEIILYSSQEFKFIELSDAYATGSSIMPQKKNPDIAELIRGKTGRIYGYHQALLVMMKGLPLSYNKDMQEDKELIFSAIEETQQCLRMMTGMIDTLNVDKNRMRQSASTGFINATDCADYLAKKGVPFREAYRITGELVARALTLQKSLEALPIEEFQKLSPHFDADIFSKINLEHCVTERKIYSGPSEASVYQQIEKLKLFLKEGE